MSVEGKAVKFGGTSLCNAIQMKKAAAIVQADSARKAVIVSAPGKRFPEDEKITDLLIRIDHSSSETEKEMLFSLIESRFDEIIQELSLTLDFHLDYQNMRRLKGDALISRGEYFCARIFAALLQAEFTDASDCIFFRADGSLDDYKIKAVISKKVMHHERVVIPGFYGRAANGSIRLFDRGGSDITGAVVADAMDADLYENFTDVPGFLLADPNMMAYAETVPIVSYRELRYLSALGAKVLHADAVLPLRKKQIPIVIRNTDAPHGPHTWIVSRKEKGIGGIVGKGGYTLITLERTHMEKEIAKTLLSVLSEYGYSPLVFAYEPDCMRVLIAHCDYEKADRIAVSLQQKTEAEIVTVRGNMAKLSIVGEGLTAKLKAEILNALEKAGLSPVFIVSMTEAFSFSLGISENDLKKAVYILHETLKNDL